MGAGQTDARLQLVVSAKNLAAGEMNKLHGSLVRLKGGMGGLAKGTRAVGGELTHMAKVGALGAVGVLAALAGAIGYATKQAATERVGIIRLNTALKDNVKGFNGNTVAIEKVIAGREKLGFADDDLRDSLGALVVKTKNVDKALQLQSLAMDLARTRNIDLGTATDTLIKISNGQFRALKGLGIAVVPVTKNYDKLIATNKNATTAQKAHAKALDTAATKTAALAAIQKATAGQAKAFGDSEVGIFETIKITIGDVIEDLGAIFLPVLKTVALFVRDSVVPALSLVVTTVSNWVKANQPLIAQVGAFVSTTLTGLFTTIGQVVPRVVAFVGALASIGTKIFNYVVPKVQAFIETLTKKGGVIDSVMGVVGPILDHLLPALGGIVKSLFGGDKQKGLIPALGDLIGVLWGGGKGPLAVGIKMIADMFTWLLKNVIGPVIDGITTLITKVIDAIEWLGKLAQPLGDLQKGGFIPGLPGSGSSSILYPHKARGGSVGPNLPFIGGENSKESLMMAGGRGYVIPDGGAAARARGGGGGPQVIHTHVYLDRREIARAISEVLAGDVAAAAPTLARS